MRTSFRFASLPIAALALCVLIVNSANAREIDCGECHEGVTFTSTAHPDVTCQECHTNVTAEHKGADL